MKLKIGIVSEPSHVKSLVKILTRRGHVVQNLGGGDEVSISNKLDLVICRHTGSSHSATDKAWQALRAGVPVIFREGKSSAIRDVDRFISMLQSGLTPMQAAQTLLGPLTKEQPPAPMEEPSSAPEITRKSRRQLSFVEPAPEVKAPAPVETQVKNKPQIYFIAPTDLEIQKVEELNLRATVVAWMKHFGWFYGGIHEYGEPQRLTSDLVSADLLPEEHCDFATKLARKLTGFHSVNVRVTAAEYYGNTSRKVPGYSALPIYRVHNGRATQMSFVVPDDLGAQYGLIDKLCLVFGGTTTPEITPTSMGNVAKGMKSPYVQIQTAPDTKNTPEPQPTEETPAMRPFTNSVYTAPPQPPVVEKSFEQEVRDLETSLREKLEALGITEFHLTKDGVQVTQVVVKTHTFAR